MRHTILRHVLVLLALLVPQGVMPVFAEWAPGRAAPAQRAGTDTRQKLLDDMASLNENLVEFALDGNLAKVRETMSAIEASLPKLRTSLPALTFSAIEARVQEQRSAVKAGSGSATALASVEIYRLLQEAMDPRLRVTPLQVPLLDYAGFKLLALARSERVDWTRVEQGVQEASGFWKQVEGRVTSPALRNLVGSIMTGLSESSAARNSGYTAFAAKMLLESVDLLEGQFTPK